MVTASTTSRLCISGEKKGGKKGQQELRSSQRGMEGGERERTGSGSVKVSDDVGHTGLVSEGGGEVDRLLGVVLGEGLHLSDSKDEGWGRSRRRSASSFPSFELKTEDTRWETGTDLSSSSDASLPGKESQGSVSGSFVLEERRERRTNVSSTVPQWRSNHAVLMIRDPQRP